MESNKTPRTDALMAGWEGKADGPFATFCELGDLAREMEAHNTDLLLALRQVEAQKDELLKARQVLGSDLLAAKSALQSIRDMTDADDPESYRCDDREGCLETVFATASRALNGDTPAAANAGGLEPAGWLYGNSYWERDNQRITDHIKKHGRPLYDRPAAADAAGQKPVARLREMEDGHFQCVNGALYDVVILDREACSDGLELYASPQDRAPAASAAALPVYDPADHLKSPESLAAFLEDFSQDSDAPTLRHAISVAVDALRRAPATSAAALSEVESLTLELQNQRELVQHWKGKAILGADYQDAKRYRWARDEGCNFVWAEIGAGNFRTGLDEAIDAAMNRAAAKGAAGLEGGAA